MMISLCVAGVAVALASHSARGHLRFFRGAGEIVAVRSQVGAIGSVVSSALWGVSPAGGDITYASDSALEVRTAIGSAVVCAGEPGRVTIPAATASKSTLSGFDASLQTGDVVDAWVADSLAAGWIRASLDSVASSQSACPAFPSPAGTLLLTLKEPLQLPVGSVLRFSRPMRMSHYRSSDGLWYFGVRDWNGDAARLNTVQPVAGPLDPHSADASKSGFTLRYLDATGAELTSPIDLGRIAIVTVTVRAKSRRPVSVAGLRRQNETFTDSVTSVVALRNAP